MRVVLDTNILVSALLVNTGTSATILRLWAEKRFQLLTSREQMQELRDTFRKPALRTRIRTQSVGRLVNDLHGLAALVHPLPAVRRSADPEDDFLLATAEAGGADYLVTGDKAGLLTLITHEGTRIVTAREFVNLLV